MLQTDAAVSAKPAFSPFEQDQSRRRFDEKAAVAAPIAAPMPMPVAVPMPALVPMPAEMVLDGGGCCSRELEPGIVIEAGDLAEKLLLLHG